MLKQTLLVAAALSLFAHTTTANPHCGKNAWVSFYSNRNGNGKACGQMTISSGKGAWDLPTDTAMKALGDCAYDRHGCSGNWVSDNHWEFCCTDEPSWKPNYSGSMNIEFSCSDGPYTCYDLHWN